MASLQDVLARIPGIGGYEAARQQNQQMEMGELQKAGALQGILAQVEGQKSKQAAMQRDTAMRAELAALGPNPDQGALAAIAAKYAPAADILKSQTSSLDRKAALEAAQGTREAQMEQARALQTERLTARAEEARQRSEDQRLSQAERNQARMEMIRLAASLRPERAPEPLHPVVGPDGKPVLLPRSQAVGKTPFSAGAQPEKALPSSLTNKYLENIQNLRKAENAVTLLEGKFVGEAIGDKNATGNKGLLTNMGVIGDKVLNAIDPEGVDTRAAIGDLGSMVIHDRSGAAVTAAEFPRLRPFIPLASDSPDVALKKSKRFVQEYKAEVDAQKEFFSASGYKVPEISGPKKTPEFATEAEAKASGVKGKVRIGGRNATIE